MAASGAEAGATVGGERAPAAAPPRVRPVSAAQADAWARREPPAMERLHPGVWAIPVPVRGPIRFVYAYLVGDGVGGGDGASGGGSGLLIDPGERSERAEAALLEAFARIGFDPARLSAILVTHFHYDHWEGADRLASRTGTPVLLSETEWGWIERLTAEGASAAGMEPWFRALGAPSEKARELAETADYRDTLAYRAPDRLLRAGELLPLEGEELEVVATAGHSPGHVCIYDRRRRLLFAGDHVLPNITPHLALNRFGGADPLAQYLDSLAAVASLGEVDVLPAHEYAFTGLGARVEELRRDVRERSDEVRAILSEHPDATAWDIVPLLRWSRPWGDYPVQQQRMALDETAAHIAHLRAAGL